MFSELNRLGVAGLRPCQKSRGDALPSEALKGEDWNGDESVLSTIFWAERVSTYILRGCAYSIRECLTLVTWLKLGEFLLCDVGASSDRGRGKEEPPVLIGNVDEIPFWMRRGGTYGSGSVLLF